MGWQWFVDVGFIDGNCNPNSAVLSMSKGGVYLSDPFAGAFPQTLFLKSASVRPAYPIPAGTGCTVPNMFAPGDFALPSICPLSSQPGGLLTPPFEIPTTIRIDRYA